MAWLLLETVEAQQDESSPDGGDAQPTQQLWGVTHAREDRNSGVALTGARQLGPAYRVKNKVSSLAV